MIYVKIFKLRTGHECELHCIDPLRSWMNQNPGNVKDGTKCSLNKDDICVGGRCRSVGCDGKFGSGARRDNCWVCDGDNSSCRKVSERKYPRGSGYVTVAKIPEGAVRVKFGFFLQSQLNENNKINE